MTILDWKGLKATYAIPYSRQHVLRLEKKRMFPKRVRLTPGPKGKVAWFKDEIEAWLRDRPRG